MTLSRIGFSFRRSLCTAAVSLMAIGTVCRADLAGDGYTQPPLFETGDSMPSQLGGLQQADNWQAASSTTITGLRWWGATATPGNPAGFVVRIFGNSAGAPGALLDEFIIGSAFTQLATGQSDFNGRDIIQYEASLSGGFSLTAGATYWLNIMNDQSGGGPLWLWHQGGGGNGSHAFRIGSGGSWSSAPGDFAFELIVPAPGALAILAVAVFAPRRRRG